PCQHLAHRSIVIAWFDAGNVEATILGLDRSFRPEHYARCHGALASRVTDIEAFDAVWRLRHLQVLPQRLEMALDSDAIQCSHAQRLGCIGVGHGHPARSEPACGAPDAHRMTGTFAERR